jgi:hypothetical protein
MCGNSKPEMRIQKPTMVFAPPRRRGAQTHSRVVAFAHSPIAALARAAPTHAMHDRPRPHALHNHHHHDHEHDCDDSKYHHDCHQHHYRYQLHRCHHHAADKADRRVVAAARWRGARATARTGRRARADAAQRRRRRRRRRMMMMRQQRMMHRWECVQTGNRDESSQITNSDQINRYSALMSTLMRSLGLLSLLILLS